MVRTIFTADKVEEAKKQLRLVLVQLSLRFTKAMQIVVYAEDEALPICLFHKSIGSRSILPTCGNASTRKFTGAST